MDLDCATHQAPRRQAAPPAWRWVIVLAALLSIGFSAQAQEPETAAAEPDTPQEVFSVQRIGQELDALLTPEGRPTLPGDTALLDKLAALATRCGVLANNVGTDEDRASLLSYEARALAALAQHAPAAQQAGEPTEDGLKRLRQTGEQMRALSLPGAKPAGAYWQMMADLSQTAGSGASLGLRQALAKQLLTDYIQAYAEREDAADYVADARLSLASLLDERGDQAGVADQLQALGEPAADSPRYAQYSRLRNRVARIGQAIDFQGITTAAQRWRLADQAGHPVLVHVYADSVAPSLKMIDAINRAIARQELGGFRIVSLRLGSPEPGARIPPWPTIPIDLTPGGVIDQLGVDALPTLAWIDHDGHLACIGHTLAVLDRVPAKPEPDPAPAPETPGVPDELTD